MKVLDLQKKINKLNGATSIFVPGYSGINLSHNHRKSEFVFPGIVAPERPLDN